jgi:hypothetical protein
MYRAGKVTANENYLTSDKNMPTSDPPVCSQKINFKKTANVHEEHLTASLTSVSKCKHGFMVFHLFTLGIPNQNLLIEWPNG